MPESVFVLVAGGALGSSFIPIYAKFRVIDQEAASRLASAVMTLSAAGAALLGAIVHILAPQLVTLVLYRERSPQEQQLMIDMVRLMMLTPFIFSISGLLMGLLQSHAAFWLPAIAISMNNIGIIIGALFIAPLLPAHPDVGQVSDLNIMGLAYGRRIKRLPASARSSFPCVIKLPTRLRPLLSPRIPGVLDVLRLMLPRVFGLAVVQINFHVNIILANTMVAGSVGAVRYAFMLTFFVLGVIAQSQGSGCLSHAGGAEGRGRLRRLQRPPFARHAQRALPVLSRFNLADRPGRAAGQRPPARRMDERQHRGRRLGNGLLRHRESAVLPCLKCFRAPSTPWKTPAHPPSPAPSPCLAISRSTSSSSS